MTTEQFLVEKYGPLLPLPVLAELLHRSKDGLRITLLYDSELSRKINPARLKIGRRVYFKASVIALILDGVESCDG